MKKHFTTKRLAALGVLLAAASVTFLIESLVPPLLPFAPYVKMGLANCFLLLVIVCFGAGDAFLFLIAKNILTIREQENTLAKLEAKTWGVTFVNGENGKFLVLPDGVKGENTWTVGDKNAVRLVRE